MIVSSGMSNVGLYGVQLNHPEWMHTIAICLGIWDVIVITFMVCVLTPAGK